MEDRKELFTLEELAGMQGPVGIPMTNDYLFRALLQRNNQVLKALICALLHLDPRQVQEVVVENPIELGLSYDDKDFILDIRARLNGGMVINLEMQVINEHNWQKRSLCYLCRSFDSLNRGEDYSVVKPVVQIGFLNFTLFSDCPEFYASYYMINEKNNHIYSDKLRLSVVDLTKIELATEIDRAYNIHLWAKFFKCMDWSELMMLAKENSDIQAAVGTVYQLSREEKIRQQCEAREDYYKRERDRQREIQRMEEVKKEIARDLQTLERGRKDLERGQQDLERGQQDLERGQQDLERGQQNLERGQQDLEKRAQELQKREKALFEQKKKLEKRIQELESQSAN